MEDLPDQPPKLVRQWAELSHSEQATVSALEEAAEKRWASRFPLPEWAKLSPRFYEPAGEPFNNWVLRNVFRAWKQGTTT